uniref:ZIP Zinc transporter n=1 Tax=Piromyces sp. TaxID=45796 RepID=A0A2S1TYS5_PIRSP|nr:ZIP Zinc transporter [Piromyces sp.]
MAFNKKLILLIFFFLSLINYSFEHGVHSDENHNHNHKQLEKFITDKIKNLSKLNQATIGAAIISSAPIPIFILIVIFNVKNIIILDIMSSFAAGALIGDVFIHNLPEINGTYEQNELYICWGILFLFILEKIISYYEQKNVKIEHNKKTKKHNHEHGHGHGHNHSNIVISLVGDFIHNLTDGMAIGAGFNKNLKIGVSLSLSIFFHEIPHEVGDFSYLLKQKMNITNAIISQLVTALGSFFGVYLSFKFGEKYSDKIISFASGAFLYLAINTIMGDLKKSNSFIHIILQAFAFVFGVYILDALI